MRIVPLLALLFTLTACQNVEERPTKVIVGATLLDGAGGSPVSDSVVVTVDGLVRSVGSRAATPIPQNSERVDGAGMFLLPAQISGNPDEFLQRYALSTLPPAQTIAQATSRASMVPGRPADFVLFRRDPTLANQNWTTAAKILRGGRWIRQ